MSWASAISATDSRWTESGFNLDRGLLRWRAGRGLAAKTKTGVGLGGVDVVLLGDSIGLGFSSAKPYDDGWFHELKLMLQSAHNPSDAPGGYGFLRLAVGNDRRPVNVTSTGTVADGTANDGAGGAWISLAIASGKANRIVALFDGTGTPNPLLRRQVTAAHLVYTKAPNANSDARLDVGTTEPGTGNGSIVSNQLLDTTAASQSNGNRVLVSGLTRTAANYIQVASGPTSGGLALYLEGIIAYDGDYDCGVRCHNLSYPSAITPWVASTNNKRTTNVTRWSGGAGSGATNAKLFIVALGANDMGNGATATTSVATFRQQMVDLCDAILAQPSAPCVMFLIHPVRCDGGGAQFARTVNHPREYLQAIYDIAATRADVCVLDLQRRLGGAMFWNSISDNSYLSMLQPHGWNVADLVHLSESAQKSLARIVFDTLA